MATLLYTCVGYVSDSRTLSLASVPSIGLIAERDSRGFASLCSAARFMLSSLINNKIESARCDCVRCDAENKTVSRFTFVLSVSVCVCVRSAAQQHKG